MKFCKTAASLMASAMLAASIVPASAQQAEMTDADIYALLIDCSAAEVLLTNATEGTSESAQHDTRASNFIRAASAFNSEGKSNDDVVDDLVASGSKIQGWVTADDIDSLGGMLEKCEKIYPIVEENFSK